MNLSFLLGLATTTIEMTACVICARYLWHVREGYKDRSRSMLATASLICGVVALFSMGLSIATAEPLAGEVFFLQPWVGLIYMAMHILMTLYPISVVQPGWLNSKRIFLLFLPVLLLGVSYLFFVGRWTPLHTPASIWQNALAPDVLIRLVAPLLMLPYCFLLFLIPYNYHLSSASFRWILQYSVCLLVICCTHIALILTYYPPLLIALPMMAAFFYLFSTEYELKDRLRPSQIMDGAASTDDLAAGGTTENADSPATASADAHMEPELWPRIVRAMDQEELWRDPDLSLGILARHCATNITTLNRTIQQETGSGFKDLVNTKRVHCVVAQLQATPDLDIQTAFFNAGYRSRATAWRNFKDIMHLTPTDFRQSLGR